MTQEAEVRDVVRTRLPYFITSALISAVLFIVMGLRMGSADAAHFVLEGATFKPLILMILPLTMVFMMKKGWDLTGTLIVCNVAGVVLNVLLGTISAATMFTVEGPVFAGMNGRMVLVRKITKTFHIDRCRGANILDGVACGATGLMPHGNPVNVVLGVVLTLENFDPNFSFLNILPYNFRCWGLLILFLLSILTGIGRKFEAEEPAEKEMVNA